MTLAFPKVSAPMAAFPRSVSSIAIAMGGLATFFVFASWLLVSYPISSTVGGYFYGIETAKQTDLSLSPGLQTITNSHQNSDSEVGDKVLPSSPSSELPDGLSDSSTGKDLAVAGKNFSLPASAVQVSMNSSESSPDIEFGEKLDQESKQEEETKEVPESSDRINIGSSKVKSSNLSDVSKTGATPVQSSLSTNASEDTSTKPECDLYHGSWFYDPLGPVYTNNSCPVLTQMQNCQGNGRPDKDYENWRWKPFQCDLPRFDANKFFKLMRGKTLAFIGDSVARNQMESMICLLWQVEAPINRGNRKMQRWYFKSARVMVVRIWSSWLVHQFNEPFDFAPQGVTKLQLDAPDNRIMEAAPQFDVVVLSSGHWFAKPSVYILNNEIVGGQLWWPDKSKPMKVNNIEAFGISVETILTAMATHPNYTGLTIVRSYSPDHYEGGAWNTGGSCTGKVKPLGAGELVKNGFTEIMHEKQVNGFNRAANKAADKSRMKLMDITEVFGYRHDGHPGPYRNPDPNKITKRGPDGRPPPQDCLHWCMPGPVDTWNEMVMEVIRREFEGRQSSR